MVKNEKQAVMYTERDRELAHAAMVVVPGQIFMINTAYSVRELDHYYNPLRMHSKGYGTWFVCVCVCLSVCLSVTTLTTTAFVSSPKLRYHRVIHQDFLDLNSRILLKRFRSRDMALFAYLG